MTKRTDLRISFHGVSEGIFTIDNDWNIKSFQLLGRESHRLFKGRSKKGKCWEIFNTERFANGCHMETTFKAKKEMLNKELIIKKKNGNSIPIRGEFTTLFRMLKVIVSGGIETFQDMTELKILSKHLEDRFSFEKIIGRARL